MQEINIYMGFPKMRNLKAIDELVLIWHFISFGLAKKDETFFVHCQLL